MSYISQFFNCARDTVLLGMHELNKEETFPQNRNRRMGGGRTAILEQGSDIDSVFLDILKEHTAGDSMDEKVKWTNLTCTDISVFLAKKGFKVSRNIVRKRLKKHGYVKRKALKKSAGEHRDRNTQFERISELKRFYETNNNPIVSIDTKKKELIGNLFR